MRKSAIFLFWIFFALPAFAAPGENDSSTIMPDETRAQVLNYFQRTRQQAQTVAHQTVQKYLYEKIPSILHERIRYAQEALALIVRAEAGSPLIPATSPYHTLYIVSAQTREQLITQFAYHYQVAVAIVDLGGIVALMPHDGGVFSTIKGTVNSFWHSRDRAVNAAELQDLLKHDTAALRTTIAKLKENALIFDMVAIFTPGRCQGLLLGAAL